MATNEIIEYERKLFFYDRILNTIVPTISLLIYSLILEFNYLVLFIGLIAGIVFAASIVYEKVHKWTDKSWDNLKVSFMIFSYFIVTASSLIFEFFSLEFLFLIPLAISLVVIYPVENKRLSFALLILFFLTALSLYAWEYLYDVIDPSYETFNHIFIGVMVYITMNCLIFSFLKVKNTQLIINQQKETLSESEKRFRDIFENSHNAAGVYCLIEERFLECNSKSIELFGYKNKADFLLAGIRDFVFEEQFNNLNDEELIQSISNQIFSTGKYFGRYRAMTKDGNPFVCQATIVSGFDDNPNHILFFMSDVSEEYNSSMIVQKQIRLLDEKNKELEKYIESNLQLENFAHVASHDLKAPLNSIKSFSGLLKEFAFEKLSDEEQKFLDFIISSSKNMQNTIDSLLSFSMASNKKLNKSWFYVSEKVNEVIQSIQINMDSANATLKMNNLGFRIFADETLFKELMQNLLLNAAKFKQTHKAPLIEISGFQYGNITQFRIKDNGIGIKNEFKDKVFLLFQKLHNNIKYEGTGIGLAICKKIVNQHEGQIWIENNQSNGICVVFTIKHPPLNKFQPKKRKAIYAQNV